MAANLGDGAGVRAVSLDRGSGATGAIDIKARAWIRPERRQRGGRGDVAEGLDPLDLLAFEPERRAAGRQNRHLVRGRQHLADRLDRARQLLQVVEHEQQRRFPGALGELADRVGRFRQTKRAGGGVGDSGGVAHGGERHERGAGNRLDRQPREGRLADSSRAGQGQQAAARIAEAVGHRSRQCVAPVDALVQSWQDECAGCGWGRSGLPRRLRHRDFRAFR